MIVKVPASSANLGIGFDTLGLALNLYNEFEFITVPADQLVGFPEDDDNLVLKAYKAFEAHYKKPHLPVRIKLLSNNIPISRGLGSSASCILAGIIAANHILKIRASYEKCVSFAADLEGHPDNIYAAAYGGLISVYNDNGDYYNNTFEIHPKLEFYLLIPEQQASTEDLRKALPDGLPYSDIVHNLSRIISLPDAFKAGNIASLRRLLDDRLHEPYRFEHLVEPKLVRSLKLYDNLVVLISGSGNTVLIIGRQIDDAIFDKLNPYYKIKQAQVHYGPIFVKK